MRLARANARATAEAESSRAVNEFLRNDLLAQAAPDNEPDREIKLRTILDRAADSIEGRFAEQPLVEASLRVTLADTYRSLGEYAAARAHRARAQAIFEQQLGARSLPALQAMAALATDLSYSGKNREGAELLERSIGQLQVVLGPEHAETLEALNKLAGMYRRDFQLAKAEEIYSRLLAIHRRQPESEHPKTFDVMNNLGVVFSQQGRFAEAEVLQRETLEHFKRVHGPERVAAH
jgi:hypothetical protein